MLPTILLVGVLYHLAEAQQSYNASAYHSLSLATPIPGHVVTWGSDLLHFADGGAAAGTGGAALATYDYLPSNNTHTTFPAATTIVCGSLIPPGNISSANVLIGLQTNDANAAHFYDVGIYNSTGTTLIADLGASNAFTDTAGIISRAWFQGTISLSAGTQYFVCWTAATATAQLYDSSQLFGLNVTTASALGRLPSAITFGTTYAIRNVPALKFIP